MKQYTRVPMPTAFILTLVSALLGACGGGSSGGDSASKPLFEQQPSTGAAVASAPQSGASAAAAEAAAPSASSQVATPADPASAVVAEDPGQQSAGATTPATSTGGAGAAAAGTQSSTTDGGAKSGNTPATPPAVVLPGGAANNVPAPSDSGQVAEVPGVQIAAGAETAAPSAASNCVINETRYYGGSCWANVKATIPSGTNRSFPNARLNHTGSVNANCIAGKVNWSTGTCKSTAAAAAASQQTAAAGTARPSGSAYKIGTFYFPGWKDNQVGAPAKFPWTRIKSYPEREPLLGWYDDGSVAVMEQQLKWMRTYGIDYVVFDWFWNGKGTELDHSIKAYLKTDTKKDVPFALLWSNHMSVPRTKLEFTSMVDYWISQYFNKPEFMKIDGKPVIFIFAHSSFVNQAKQFGETVPSLLAQAEARAKAAGYKGIYFVGGTHVDSSLLKTAATSGYSALSAYNYHGRSDDVSTSFEELDSAYQHVWNWILKESSIPYILPMTQGWDKRPWGGSPNPMHDMSGGVLSDFERHLAEARRLMDANPSKTMKTGVICCWNEFGEGSYIEPTKKEAFDYLEKVQKVFGSP